MKQQLVGKYALVPLSYFAANRLPKAICLQQHNSRFFALF